MVDSTQVRIEKNVLRKWVAAELQSLVSKMEDMVVEGELSDDEVAEVLDEFRLAEQWQRFITPA